MAEDTYTVWDYIRSFLSMPFFFLLLLLATPVILLLLLLSLGKLNNFVIEKLAPILAKPTLAFLGVSFRVKKHTEEIASPAVYIINHSSTLDMLTLLAMGLPRVRFVAKWQFQYNPLFFVLGRLTGQVFIRREHSEKAIRTLQKVVNRIQRQRLSLMMAPEGSRKHEGVIGPFKKGPFRMAMELGYPIVPIYFEGNRELSSGKFLVTKKGSCTAHVHSPIDTSSWTSKNLEQQISEVRDLYLNWAGVEE
ncbi:MAG: 1-acyl-sn-glycerol-3-phosphate acyltransferase [Balneolaceae bacterium]|nr:MAG: 1-acyl-sn-glycerol-3-phosphate acyltransferase [Balneolaceae bacterium]